MKAYDALHLACAEYGGAEVLENYYFTYHHLNMFYLLNMFCLPFFCLLFFIYPSASQVGVDSTGLDIKVIPAIITTYPDEDKQTTFYINVYNNGSSRKRFYPERTDIKPALSLRMNRPFVTYTQGKYSCMLKKNEHWEGYLKFLHDRSSIPAKVKLTFTYHEGGKSKLQDIWVKLNIPDMQ